MEGKELEREMENKSAISPPALLATSDCNGVPSVCRHCHWRCHWRFPCKGKARPVRHLSTSYLDYTNITNRASVVDITKAASTLDASPIPTPTNLPPFPTGQFLLRIGSPDETEQNCLTDSSQTEAWSCNIPPTSVIISTDNLS